MGFTVHALGLLSMFAMVFARTSLGFCQDFVRVWRREGLRIAPWRDKIAPRRSKNRSQIAWGTPKSSLRASKTSNIKFFHAFLNISGRFRSPRTPKSRLRTPMSCPRTRKSTPEPPKRFQEPPKRPQEPPKSAQEPPKSTQEPPKSCPKTSKNLLRALKSQLRCAQEPAKSLLRRAIRNSLSAPRR